jgi:hypothetical protein
VLPVFFSKKKKQISLNRNSLNISPQDIYQLDLELNPLNSRPLESTTCSSNPLDNPLGINCANINVGSSSPTAELPTHLKIDLDGP